MDTGDRVGVGHELGHGTENEVGKGHRLEIKDSGKWWGAKQGRGGKGDGGEDESRYLEGWGLEFRMGMEAGETWA